MTAEVKVAETVTALLGIVNVHGLLVEPLEHEAPVTVQLANMYAKAAVAATEIGEPTVSLQPVGPGQLGVTEPEPVLMSVVSVADFCWGRYASICWVVGTKICPSPALSELKCVGSDPIVA